MNNALRYSGAAFVLGLLLTGLIALLHNLTGEHSESLAVPCLLMVLGLGSGALAWHFPGLGGGSGCDEDDFASSGERRSDDSEAA